MSSSRTSETELEKTPGYLSATLNCKCPRCRKGDLFQYKNAYNLKDGNYMKMNERCSECGQPTEIELGFYYGTSYVSYALTILFSAITFVLWWIIIGISLNDNRLFWWLGIDVFFLLLLQPFFMRLARSFWISCYVKYNKNWQIEKPVEPERTNDRLKNAW